MRIVGGICGVMMYCSDHIQNALNMTWLSSRESVPNNFNQSRLTVTVGEGSGDSKSLFCEVVALSIRDA
jgi:hypothetical protein